MDNSIILLGRFKAIKIRIILMLSLLFLFLFIISCNGSKYNRKAIDLNNQASDFMQKKDYISAIPLLERAINLDPQYSVGYNNLIVARLGLNDYENALKVAIKQSEEGTSIPPEFRYYYAYLLSSYLKHQLDADKYHKLLISGYANLEIAEMNLNQLLNHLFLLSFEKENNIKIIESIISALEERNDLLDMHKDIITQIIENTGDQMRLSVMY